MLDAHPTIFCFRVSGLFPSFGFVVEFWVFIDWSHPNIPHTHHDARRPRHDFSFLSFPGTIFPGTNFPGTIFPKTIFPGDHLSEINFIVLVTHDLWAWTEQSYDTKRIRECLWLSFSITSSTIRLKASARNILSQDITSMMTLLSGHKTFVCSSSLHSFHSRIGWKRRPPCACVCRAELLKTRCIFYTVTEWNANDDRWLCASSFSSVLRSFASGERVDDEIDGIKQERENGTKNIMLNSK